MEAVLVTAVQFEQLKARYSTGYRALSILIGVETACLIIGWLAVIVGGVVGLLVGGGAGMLISGITVLFGLIAYLIRVLAIGLLQIVRSVLDTAVYSCNALTHDMRMEIMGLPFDSSRSEAAAKMPTTRVAGDGCDADLF